MDDTPVQHQRLIAQFIARGVHAGFRQWAMGDTVFVGGRPIDMGGFPGFERGAYLIPSGNGQWQIFLEFFDSTPVPEAVVVDRVVQLLFDDDEYERETERRRKLPENGGRSAIE